MVPDNTIAIVTESDNYEDVVFDIIEPLNGKNKRDWFSKHAHFCLPLTIGNQYGFIIKSLHDFKAVWNGGDTLEDVQVQLLSGENPHQMISSHFGIGTITIQNRFYYFFHPCNVLLSPSVHYYNAILLCHLMVLQSFFHIPPRLFQPKYFHLLFLIYEFQS